MSAASSRGSATRRPARAAARRRLETADAGTERGDDPFSQAWWQRLCAGAPPEVQPLLSQLNDHGRAFHALGRYYADALRATPHGSPADVCAAALQALETALAQSSGALLAPWQHALDAHPLASWASTTHPFAAADPARAGAALESLARSGQALAEVVGVGGRWAGEPEETARRWSGYAHAAAAYAALFQDMAHDAVARVRHRIDQHAHRGEIVDSPRALYELWLECGEAAYLEMLRSERYARCYGTLINRLLALRRHTQELAGGIGRLLGSADAEAQAALRQRVEASRRELRALRGETSSERDGSERRRRDTGAKKRGTARTKDGKRKAR
ncbi:MAG: hypothetical protein GWN84_02700 [Gammaproteobacteria bacterium]|nr:hypothetical protein [Gammaproteobacteria bacterium]NIR82062.1 hypothetical protein [Gammaproteobacteria bacterium]NIR89290.1 hypothetical protein [Gammaproteobacteria bacterium]NIU03172.1 hypothetical protein [Gammaproteobacteria bacterium]NIV50688.1 hypothetical protein [Gammaproteobacteria bacterium]